MFKKISFLISFIGILFIISACGSQEAPKTATQDANGKPVTDISVNTPEPKAQISDTAQPKRSYDLIQEALIKESGKTGNDFTLGIRKLTEDHFLGIVSGKQGVILAVKKNDEWAIVFDGVFGAEKTYKCADIAKYNFPEDMISDCQK